MRARDYIKATVTLLEEHKDPVIVLAGLNALLAKKHHEALYPQILRGIEQALTKQLSANSTRITLASHSDTRALAAAQNALQPDEAFVTNVDPSIVGGFTLERENSVLDQSYKKQLLNLYRSLIG